MSRPSPTSRLWRRSDTRFGNFSRQPMSSWSATVWGRAATRRCWPSKRTGRTAHISVGELAELLLIRHNTAAELVKRLERAGLVRKWYDPADRRRALLALSEDGQAKLGEIATAQLQRLHESRAALLAIFGLPTPGSSGR